MFIIFNKDGSIYARTQSDFVMQGSNRVNKVFVGFVDNEYSGWSCSGLFTLPNSTLKTIPATIVNGGFEYLGTTYQGWVIDITNEITRYSGNVAMSVNVVNQELSVLYTYLANITINATGYPINLEWDDSITVAQFNDYMAQLAAKLQANTMSVVVSENDLPAVGTQNVLYFVLGATSNTPYQVKMWNGSEYSLLGTINLSSFASKEEQAQFESEFQQEWQDYKNDVNARINTINAKVDNAIDLTPIPVATVNDLPSGGATQPYVVQENGYWYYWNGTQWVQGQQYQAITGYKTLSVGSLDKAYVDNIVANAGSLCFVNLEGIGADLTNETSGGLVIGEGYAWYETESDRVFLWLYGGFYEVLINPDGTGNYYLRNFVVASRVGYDNSSSGSNANNVQDAIDELTEEKFDAKFVETETTSYKTGEFTEPKAIISTFNGWGIPFNKTMIKDVLQTVQVELNMQPTTQNVRCIIFDENRNIIKEVSKVSTNGINNFDINIGKDKILSDLFYIGIVGENITDYHLMLGKIDVYQSAWFLNFAKEQNYFYFTPEFMSGLTGAGEVGYKDTYFMLISKEYKELAYKKDVLSKEDGVSKQEIGYEKIDNPNVWNITTEVKYSWSNPSNGVIENYPDNPTLSGYMRSGYLNIKPNTTYILSCEQTNYWGFVFVSLFDENKNFISSITVHGSGEHINGTIIVIPDNSLIKYAIISVSQNALTKIQLEEGTEITNYQEYTGVDFVYANNVLIKKTQIVETQKVIKLPKTIYAVVGDTLELFYKGIIKTNNYKNYYIECICDVGNSYDRKYVLTPVASHIGNHTLSINLYSNEGMLIETVQTTITIAEKTTSPESQKNILCIGDSLTEGGYWVQELHRRLCLTTNIDYLGHSAPTGLGLSNINFIGKRTSSSGIKFEGYGGWTFASYLSTTSPTQYWVVVNNHDKTSADQESIWQDANGVQWQLETIETNKLKFKLYNTTTPTAMPSSGILTWISGGTHTNNIAFTQSYLSGGNPFAYNGVVDFSAYCQELGVSTIDEVYILLGWNSGNQFMTDKESYRTDVNTLIGLLRTFNPNIKICLMGLEIPSLNGMGKNYGAGSFWTYIKQQKYVFDLNDFYQEIADSYNDNVFFMNICSQFDTEYNMQVQNQNPNTRNPDVELSVQINGVHPAVEGYFQIADVVYRFFNANN